MEHGVSEELLPLFRIGPDLVHAHRARALFQAGFKNHEDLAVVSRGVVVCRGKVRHVESARTADLSI